MNYWMFTIMYDWFPKLWPTLIQRGLAAQHYPAGWPNEKRNVKALQQMKRDDAVIAALMKHRFAGYGFLTSDFFRDGKPLPIRRDGERYAFRERAEIDWTVIPVDAEKPYVDCRHLKAQGYDVDLRHGLCVKRVDEKTFSKLKEVLDNAGARTQLKHRLPRGAKKFQDVRSFIEGKRVPGQTEGRERNPGAQAVYPPTRYKLQRLRYEFRGRVRRNWNRVH